MGNMGTSLLTNTQESTKRRGAHHKTAEAGKYQQSNQSQTSCVPQETEANEQANFWGPRGQKTSHNSSEHRNKKDDNRPG